MHKVRLFYKILKSIEIRILGSYVKNKARLDIEIIYCFVKHKGYGTKMDTEAIAEYGLDPIHRPSFCKKM